MAAPPAGVQGISSNQQWGSQQPARPSSQPSIPISHPPTLWERHYSNQPSTLYPPPGSHQVLIPKYVAKLCLFRNSLSIFTILPIQLLGIDNYIDK